MLFFSEFCCASFPCWLEHLSRTFCAKSAWFLLHGSVSPADFNSYISFCLKCLLGGYHFGKQHGMTSTQAQSAQNVSNCQCMSGPGSNMTMGCNAQAFLCRDECPASSCYTLRWLMDPHMLCQQKHLIHMTHMTM